VRIRHNAAEAIRQRGRRRSDAEAEGRTIRKWERRPDAREGPPSR
jgi:hypothetical protein